MENAKVSIITVCLNSETTIERTIQSVLGQTYRNIEYIIIDGGSTDKTLKIIEKYKDGIAKCISEKDNGLYDAMNKGIAMATGDIIGIINSDDWYMNDAVENVVHAFSTKEADVVYGAMEIVHSDGYTSKVKNGKLEQMLYRMVVPHPTAFVRRSVYENVGKFDLQYKIVADYDLFLRMYLYPVKMHQIPFVLAFFGDGGLSTVKAVECADEVRAVAERSAKQRGDFKALEQIEKYYQIRMQNAKMTEKVHWILRENEKITLPFSEKWPLGERKVNIFGAGNVGAECFRFLKEMNIPVDCFLDNDETKCREMFLERPVKKCVAKEENKNYIVVAVMNYQEEIIRQLEIMNYQRGQDFCLYSDIVEKLFEKMKEKQI